MRGISIAVTLWMLGASAAVAQPAPSQKPAASPAATPSATGAGTASAGVHGPGAADAERKVRVRVTVDVIDPSRDVKDIISELRSRQPDRPPRVTPAGAVHAPPREQRIEQRIQQRIEQREGKRELRRERRELRQERLERRQRLLGPGSGRPLRQPVRRALR